MLFFFETIESKSMKFHHRSVFLFIVCILITSSFNQKTSRTTTNPIFRAFSAFTQTCHSAEPFLAVGKKEPRYHQQGSQGMVVCVSEAAAEVGRKILQQKGNAVDAAVATALAMAVTYPAAGNIGGGGFMLIMPADGKNPEVIDYRETAPSQAQKDSFIGETSALTHKAVGVPGTIRGLALAHSKYGKLKWQEVVTPAISLARDGFPLSKHVADSLNSVLSSKKTSRNFRNYFAKSDGKKWQIGDILVQKDLAHTLEIVAKQGADSFYQGPLADLLVAEMKRGNGWINNDDLKNYRAIVRKPLHGTYRGYDIFVPPPASGGGIYLLECLNILENCKLSELGADSPESYHYIVEAMKWSFRDRAEFLGDSAFVKIPDKLLQKDYAKSIWQKIDPDKATPSKNIAPPIEISKESNQTTHFSIIDASGLAVSNTYTLEESFGSRIVVPGAGYLLNNEMGDFNWTPGKTTIHGKIGTTPNQIQGSKRMLSSQTPTIVRKEGKTILITGSPGGRTIPNTVLCILISWLDFQQSIEQSIRSPRFHHQWFPDQISMEPGKFSEKIINGLKQKGHQIHFYKDHQGDAHSIWIDPKTNLYHGIADSRLDGFARGY